MENDSAVPQSNLLRYQHYGVLGCGCLVGFCAALLAAGFPFDFPGALEEARRLGIVSRTVLSGYPKSRDVVCYALTVLLPVCCGLGAWFAWSWGRRPALVAMFVEDTEAGGRGLNRWPPVVVLAIVAVFLLVTFDLNDFYAPIDGWSFLGEEGEYLAWAQSLLDGGTYARDFFATRGPLVLYPLAWALKLFGATLPVARFYTYGLNLIATAILVFFLYRCIRHRGVFVLSVSLALVMFSGGGGRVDAGLLRIFLGLLPLILLHREEVSGLTALSAGAACGLSMLYSQEVGVCSFLAVLLLLALKARVQENRSGVVRQGALVVAGCATVLGAVLGCFFLAGAGYQCLDNLFSLMRLVMLGYASLPFPGLADFLSAPLSGGALLPYWTIGVYVVCAISLSVRFSLGLGSRELELRAALLVFGLLLFRVALGRSDASHYYFASVPAFLLIFLWLDATVAGRRTPSPLNRVHLSMMALLLCSILLLVANTRALQVQVSTVLAGIESFGSKFTLRQEGDVLLQLPRAGVFFSRDTAQNLMRIGGGWIAIRTRGTMYFFSRSSRPTTFSSIGATLPATSMPISRLPPPSVGK